MSKRFRDTEVWSKPWYRKLPPALKCLWDFILDHCDSVGVWIPDFEAAEFNIGEKVEWEKLLEAANGNIEVLPSGKWWIVDFCAFQYGELREECRPHISYLLLLRKHGLEERVSKGYPKGIQTHKEKEKEKEKESSSSSSSKTKNSDKTLGEKMRWDFGSHIWYGIIDEQVEMWQEAYPAVDVELELRQMGEWCEAAGAKGHKQNWKRFIVNWLKRAQDKPGGRR